MLIAAVAGGTLGYFMRFDLPNVRGLEDYSPPEMSRALDSHGELVGTFAEQRRLLVAYDEIPTVLEQALAIWIVSYGADSDEARNTERALTRARQ